MRFTDTRCRPIEIGGAERNIFICKNAIGVDIIVAFMLVRIMIVIAFSLFHGIKCKTIKVQAIDRSSGHKINEEQGVQLLFSGKTGPMTWGMYNGQCLVFSLRILFRVEQRVIILVYRTFLLSGVRIFLLLWGPSPAIELTRKTRWNHTH